MMVTLDNDLAVDMTLHLFNKDSIASPEQKDFYYNIIRSGVTFEVRWSKDIAVTDPKWHIIVTKLD